MKGTVLRISGSNAISTVFILSLRMSKQGEPAGVAIQKKGRFDI
jgi:hypothetical protein